jgi:hypothetical protein
LAFSQLIEIGCDSTRFWANGITRQPAWPSPHTTQVMIPPDAVPSQIWLLMKGTNNISPTVGKTPAHLVSVSKKSRFGASLWSAPVTQTMLDEGSFMVTTTNSRQLNAIFLFNKDDPPFSEKDLNDLSKTTETLTYSIDIPSVAPQTIDIIIPFIDITYLTDSLSPEINTSITTITVQFNGQSQTIIANNPNLGNGLLMTQFPFSIGPLTNAITTTKVLTININTEDTIYTLGPRVCRPVYVENTSWLCNKETKCISATTKNLPENLSVNFSRILR